MRRWSFDIYKESYFYDQLQFHCHVSEAVSAPACNPIGYCLQIYPYRESYV